MNNFTNTADIITDMIAKCQKNLEAAQSQLRMIQSALCLERCNSICVFPGTGLTIQAGADGKPEISPKLFATQFEPATAKEICEKVSNGHGVHPVIMSPVQYYTFQVEICERDLQMWEDMKTKKA